MKSNELKPGNAIMLDGRLLICVKTEHVKPGKGPAYIQAKLKDPTGVGGYVEKRFGSSDTIEGTTLDRRDCEYLYNEGDSYVFMDSESFEQFNVMPNIAGDQMLYIKENGTCTVMFHDEKPLMLEPPAAVELEVRECEPGAPKGSTATNVMKEATMETGLKTRVPDFIQAGEILRISTADGSYLSRA